MIGYICNPVPYVNFEIIDIMDWLIAEYTIFSIYLYLMESGSRESSINEYIRYICNLSGMTF